MTKEPERIIAEAFRAWSSLDVERITQCFSEDAVFHIAL
jgi:ketosteroid isomerase-like protein